MKTIIQIIFFTSIVLVIVGYIIENITDNKGEMYIGLGVMMFAFLFMPLFIYYRYKDKVGDFIDKRMEQPENSSKTED